MEASSAVKGEKLTERVAQRPLNTCGSNGKTSSNHKKHNNVNAFPLSTPTCGLTGEPHFPPAVRTPRRRNRLLTITTPALAITGIVWCSLPSSNRQVRPKQSPCRYKGSACRGPAGRGRSCPGKRPSPPGCGPHCWPWRRRSSARCTRCQQDEKKPLGRAAVTDRSMTIAFIETSPARQAQPPSAQPGLRSGTMETRKRSP